MEDNLKIWNAVDKPPEEALKQIKGGRLSGMTDIKPQWRYRAMTEQFGPCGIGWKYTITKEWTESGSEDQLLCFVIVDLFFKHGEAWSDAIPGSGGSMLVTKESKGLHTSDEGFKMALTDALSVAMSRIGVAAEIYMGNWTGSKYKDQPKGQEKKEAKKNWLKEIKAAKDEFGLQHIFKEAWENTKGKERDSIKKEYDLRKVQITELGGSSQAQRGE